MDEGCVDGGDGVDVGGEFEEGEGGEDGVGVLGFEVEVMGECEVFGGKEWGGRGFDEGDVVEVGDGGVGGGGGVFWFEGVLVV